MAMTKLNRQRNHTANGPMKNHVNVDEWVAMFEEIGLNEAQRLRWHKLFEARHPDAHQGFLEWLRISPEDIARYRAMSRAGSK